MYTLNVEKRDQEIKAKKLRRMGIIPGSIGGRNLEQNILIQLSATEAKKFLRENARGALVTLSCGDATYRAMLKDITRAPMDGQIQDLSFQMLSDGEPVNGIAQIAFKNADKINSPIHKLVNEIPYRALPENIIETIDIDISRLRSGDRVKVSDLPISSMTEIEVQLSPDTIVLSIEGHR